jgi:hypothetical protein
MAKKLNNVTVYFDEHDFEQLMLEADADDRTPAEFLRRLFRLHMRDKVVARLQEREANQQAVTGSSQPPSVTRVEDFLKRKNEPVQFSVGWADTEQQK